ncbi:DnaJ-domain-containing protein [Zopfia rhizophila CBS 207.26]|uniref:DnaJ-domain-containing protein n=1 Tax=Zopfia rhizophila CBS 207.26 TaxID=1314779 RepID=A0A6A6EQY5_9PEZI|nr:DnaJ-domain-containing protein [Zopfia rhizophila CBS 207.26]
MPPKRKNKKSKVENDSENEEFNERDLVDEEPPTIDPYAVLGLEKEATADDVKKAYRKAALMNHPDKAKNEDEAAANQKFQEIAFAYAVLSDERRRKRYDLTGSTAEVLGDDDDDFNWLKFYRGQFEDVITEESVNKFAEEYKGSDEEHQTLLDAYTKHKGDLGAIYEIVLVSDILEDDDRFRKILDEEIAAGNIKAYPAYMRENDQTREKAKAKERKRRADFDRKRAKKSDSKNQGNKSGGGMGDLAALIQQRQKARADNFFDDLTAKLEPASRKRGTPMDEPPEEAFQANAERMKRGKKQKKARADSENEEEAPKASKGKGKMSRGRRAKASV